MIVLPAIDLLDGKAVRLHQGRYDQVTVYSEDPAALAASIRGKVPRLHVVDLEGARRGRAAQRELVVRIVEAFGPGVQTGGGVRDMAAVESYFELGVERVVLGTAAVRSPELVREAAQRFPGRIVVALDAKDGMVALEGWEEVSTLRALDLAKSLEDLPIAAFLYTDVARDGTQTGPNLVTTAELGRATRIPVLASGGVGSLEHLRALARLSGIEGAIVGRALYEKSFTLDEAIRAAEG